MNDQTDEIESSEKWNVAGRYAGLLDPIPHIIREANPTLWTAGEDTDFQIPDECYEAIRRPAKSAVLTSPLYFAAMTLFPERFQALREDDASVVLLEILRPKLLCVLLSFVFYHRRLTKLCPTEEWERLSPELIRNMELGFILGKNLPKLGPARAILISGIKHIALATFLVRDKEAFFRYRVDCKRKLDFNYEQKVFQCDHCQVAAHLVKKAGFYYDFVEIAEALRIVDTPKRLSPEAKMLHSAVLILDHLQSTDYEIQEDQNLDELGANEAAIEAINADLEQLSNDKSRFTWMKKTSAALDEI